MAMAIGRSRLKTYAGFIKLEHSVFSLPVIYAAALLQGWPSLRVLGLILLAAVGGRVMAMGLNRLIDAAIDRRNPRTARRELARGAMAAGEAWAIIGVAGLLYLASAAAISPLCLQLAPIPVALFVGYPYLKRFTILAHLGLGLTWSLAVLAGWVATSPTVHRLEEIGPVWLYSFVWAAGREVGPLWLFAFLWVTGFDIIYATMDEAFDRQAGLRSLPAALGKRRALDIAAIFHVLAFLSLVALWFDRPGTARAVWPLAAIGALLVWEHLIAERKPETAFLQVNALIGALVLLLVLAGVR
jgi:4-hydroxybenzoate polyprenyltransferase